MPRTPEQYEKIREAKRQQIMDAALEVFANEGYNNASISKIASQAKISKGLMYNYFDSKEELIKAILDEGLETLASVFDPNKDGILTPDEFDFFVDNTFKMLLENPSYWRLYFSIMMQPGIHLLIRERFESVLAESLQVLINYYEKQGVEDPVSEALIFGAAMDGISMNYLLNPKMFPVDKVKKTIIERFGHKNKE